MQKLHFSSIFLMLREVSNTFLTNKKGKFFFVGTGFQPQSFSRVPMYALEQIFTMQMHLKIITVL